MHIAVTSGVNSVVQFITVLIIFVIVLFLTYATTRFIGNYQKAGTENSNFKIIDTYRVSNNKYIQIIQVGKKYLVISVCKDSITMLAEVLEEEIKIPEYGNSQESFSKILEKIKSRKTHTNNKEQEDEQDE